ncbi:MAG: carboxypeptidase regulatory-like domain-containing protein, partial [Armatimonadetes bacterium]|nr:carboxypeptidase regulatory-like domain-containing protein [Armatimonadota bacterium]
PSSRTVFVQQNAAERADFVVTRLCRIAGRVYVQAGPAQYGEALGGAIIELSNGQRATTNSTGSYSFDSLPPGRYTASFASPTDASTLTPTSPTSWSFRLEPGDEVTGADFAFARRERPVVFDAVSE